MTWLADYLSIVDDAANINISALLGGLAAHGREKQASMRRISCVDLSADNPRCVKISTLDYRSIAPWR